MIIRKEHPEDREAIRAVNMSAFPASEEAGIVDKLRSDGDAILSLVAEEQGEIVGHILFERVIIAEVPAASLAPMAVKPAWQRRGIGSALVRHGLDECRALGERIVVVLGHPAFYPRFGFSAELARPLQGFAPGPAWMALELTPGALSGLRGKVQYPKAFFGLST